MKLKKLMERVSDFLNADTRTQMDEIKSIRKVLKELKSKERNLKETLEAPPKKMTPDELDELKIQLNVIYAQRKKGIERVKEIKCLLKEKKQTKKK